MFFRPVSHSAEKLIGQGFHYQSNPGLGWSCCFLFLVTTLVAKEQRKHADNNERAKYDAGFHSAFAPEFVAAAGGKDETNFLPAESLQIPQTKADNTPQ
jgi:hypothetical protein